MSDHDQPSIQPRKALNQRARHDMLVGGLFCVGGIIFGAVQFVRGLSNLQ